MIFLNPNTTFSKCVDIIQSNLFKYQRKVQQSITYLFKQQNRILNEYNNIQDKNKN